MTDFGPTEHRRGAPTYVATQAEVDAEASLADDLANVLTQVISGLDEAGEVERVLTRYQRARV